MAVKTISILGCGWLGFPLAKTLIENRFAVNGSTTSESKLALLEENCIQSFLMSISEDHIIGDIDSFLKEIDVLIIDIPPKSAHSDFTKKMQTLLPYIENSKVAKIIFISSTSVYGENNEWVTESTTPNPATTNGKQLVIVEQLFQNNPAFATTVIRFGGLIGEDRHPIKFLSGRKEVENPEAPINLIHQKDCIGIILKIIKKDIYGEIFNAVAPFHPSRKNYYEHQASRLGLPLPEFAPQTNKTGKTISAEKIKTVLEYRFLVPKL